MHSSSRATRHSLPIRSELSGRRRGLNHLRRESYATRLGP